MMMGQGLKGRGLLLLLGGVLAGILLGLAILYGKALLGQPGAPQETITVGSPAPDFELPGLDGKPGKLSDYLGHPLVLNFWATWCAPCKKEMPLLESYYQKYSPGLVVLGLNSGETAPVATDFVKTVNISFPVLLDQSMKVGAEYLVRGFPTTFFIDQQGILRSIHIGELDEKLLRQYLPAIGIQP